MVGYNLQGIARNQRETACLPPDFLLALFFAPEDVGDMFLRNVGLVSTEYTTLYSRRQDSV
jgi:hypothetical protein